MNNRKRIISIAFASVAMLLLILDAKTASAGASAGVDLCIKVIVPSLFPFFVVTTYLNTSLLGINIPGLQSLGRQLSIPDGSTSLLLLGLIGGYPVGAQLIADAYKQEKLERRTACILLGYCSNAGPAFIFGIAGTLFSSLWAPLLLWGIHLLSAIAAGFLLPKPVQASFQRDNMPSCSLVQALRKSILVCTSVCGWIILFKVILAYWNKWFARYFGYTATVLISGILELSNGCINLMALSSESYRFILCAAFLGFGGICVILQTKSVSGPLGLGLYIPGKIMQTCISSVIATPISYLLFPSSGLPVPYAVLIFIISCPVIAGMAVFAENRYGNLEKNPV